MGIPIITGLKMNRVFNWSTFISNIAPYFRRNEFIIVRVVIISTLMSSRILWNVPESWSAWQWLMITALIKIVGIPIYFKWYEANGGGSTIIPLPYTQKMYPDTDPLGSNPCEHPNTVTPKSGGVKECSCSSSISSIIIDPVCTCPA